MLTYRRRAIAAAFVLAILGILLGVAFAGSPSKLAEGVRIAGVDVGGLSASEARHRLEQRSRALESVPVVFTAGEREFRIKPVTLGVRVDWNAAVSAAHRQGEGFGPLRGFRRIGVRVFGADVAPPTQVYNAALEYELSLLAKRIDRPHRDASLHLRGLHPVIFAGRAGAVLDRHAAATVIVRALAGFSRAPVALPVRTDAQRVTASALKPALAQAGTALSAPVRLALGPTRWRLPRWRIAGLLDLPHGGRTTLRIGGPGAAAFFSRLEGTVDRQPRDADFEITSRGVAVVPARAGVSLDREASGRAILAAAVGQGNRVAELSVGTAKPHRTTAEARAMGIMGLVGTYTTLYGGDPNRIHNVQLVARLIDRHVIPPGATFSFNDTTGERTAAKGFREAPVIINGELQTGLGGGVCQVSTTVFNAAYEAGLKITERTNHALYISHYPLGRDATVNYPDTDLKFVNDTPHWLLVRTFVGASSLTVSLYGTPQHRRVESVAAPLVVTGQPPVKETDDPDLPVGSKIVDDAGVPSQSTHVERKVYTASGKLLYDDTWYSSYRAEPELVRIGTKVPPPPKKKPPATTGSTTTGPTTTGATTTGTTTKTQP
jgi:vancomycin resistance protein YoaR